MTAIKAGERAYTIDEAAALYSLSPSTIRAAVKATEGNVLHAVNISSVAQPRYRIPADELAAWFSRMGD